MVMHSLAFCAGLFVAWCTFEAFRRVGGRLWLVVVGLSAVGVCAAEFDFKFKNNSGSAVDVQWEMRVDGGSYASQSQVNNIAGGALESGGSHYYSTGSSRDVRFRSSPTGAGTWSSWSSDTALTVQPPYVLQEINVFAAPSYTNYTSGLQCITNTTGATADFTFQLFDLSLNVIPYGDGGTVTLPPGGWACWEFEGDEPFVWQIMCPGDAETGWAQRVCSSGDATGGVSGSPPAGSDPPDTGDDGPFDNPPPRPGDTNAPTQRDIEALIDAINDSSNNQNVAITNAIARLQAALTNGLGDIYLTNSINITNGFDLGWTNILQAISTNTATITNQLRGDTNTLQGFVDSVNTVMGNASNSFNGGVYGGFLLDAQSDVISGTDTNQSVGSGSASVFMATIVGPHGRSWVLNMDPLTNHGSEASGQSGMRAVFISWLNWLRDWILKLIPYVMWWLFTRKLFEFAHEPLVLGTQAVKNPDAAPWAIAGRLVGAALIAVLAAAVAFLPVALVARMQELTFLNPSIPSLAGHISNESSGTWGAAAVRFFAVLSEAIPFSTLVFCLAHYMAFELYGRQLLTGFIWSLQAFKWIVWSLVLLGGMNAEAASVQFLNLTTNQVKLTNSARMMWLPTGATVFNLEDTGWGIDGVGPVDLLDESEPENEIVIRVSQSDIGALVVDGAFDPGEWSWFWGGYRVGFTFFGLAYAVAAVRNGVNAAARNAVAD